MAIPTKSLIHFDAYPWVSETGSTVTDGGTQHYNTTDQKFGAGCAEMGDTNARIWVPNSTISNSGDFTVEGWFKNYSYTGFQALFFFGNEVSGRKAIGWNSGSSGTLVIDNYGVGTVHTFGSMTRNVWNHIAIVRSGNYITCYVNGTQLGSAYNFGSGAFGNSGAYYFGGDSNGVSLFQGWIDEVRFSDTARYTSNFTAPTAPFTLEVDGNTATIAATLARPTAVVAANAVTFGTASVTMPMPTAAFAGVSVIPVTGTATVTMSRPTVVSNGQHAVPAFSLFHTDTDFTNSGTLGAYSVVTLNSNTPVVSTTKSKFGGASGYFAGGHLLYNRSSSTNMGDSGFGDWTIECWFNVESFATYPHLFSMDSGPSQRFNIYIDKANGQLVFYSQAGSGYFPLATATGAISLDTWYHVALVRSGAGYYTLYLNGVSQGTSNAYSLPAGQLDLHIGGSPVNGNPDYLIGYIDEFRITKRAVYSSNFTPQTAPFIAGEYPGDWTTDAVGTIAATLARPTVVASAAHGVSSTISATLALPGVVAAGNHVAPPTGIISATLAMPTAVVSSTVTPPITSTVAVTMPMPTAAFMGAFVVVNTKVLMHFDATPFYDECGGTVTGDDQYTASGKFGGSSFSTGFLGLETIVPAGSYNFTTGDMTAEVWYRPTSNSTTNGGTLISFGNEASGVIVLEHYTTNGLRLRSGVASGSPSTLATFAATMAVNTFHHIALVREGNNIRIYVNGTQAGSTYAFGSGSFGNSASISLMWRSNRSLPNECRVDEFRLSNIARYTSNFSVPTAPFVVEGQTWYGTINATMALPTVAVLANTPTVATIAATMPMPTVVATGKSGYYGDIATTLALPNVAVAATFTMGARIGTIDITMAMPTATFQGVVSNTLNLVHFDENYLGQPYLYKDEAGIGYFSQDAGSPNSMLSTADSVFGGSSYYVNHIGASTQSNVSLTTGSFTVEGRFKYDSYANGSQRPLFQFNDFNNGAQIFLDSSNRIVFQRYVSGSTTVNKVFGNAPAADTWHHFAFVRNGTSLVCYVNGTQLGTAVTVSGALGDYDFFRVASAYTGSSFIGAYYGYIDEVRVSNVARWTSNFTVPTQPYIIEGTEPRGQINTTLALPTVAFASTHIQYVGALAVTLDRPSVVASGDTINYVGVANVTIPAPNTVINGAYGPAVSIDAIMPFPVVQIAAHTLVDGNIDVTLPMPDAAFDTRHGVSVVVSAIMPAPIVEVDYRHGVSGSASVILDLPTVYFQTFASEQIRSFSGAIGETLVLSRTLSDDERFMVEGYLAWKWHVQHLLPANHVYRWRPPVKNYVPPRYADLDVVLPRPDAVVAAERMDAMIVHLARPTAAVEAATNPALVMAATLARPNVEWMMGTNDNLDLSVDMEMPRVAMMAGHGTSSTATATLARPSVAANFHFGYQLNVAPSLPRPSVYMQVGDPHWDKVSLLLQNRLSSGPLTDYSPRPKTITGRSMTSATDVPFSPPYNYANRFSYSTTTFFNGASDNSSFITIQKDNNYPNDYDMGTGDFTFELWLKKKGSKFDGKRLLSRQSTGAGQFYIEIDEDTGKVYNGAFDTYDFPDTEREPDSYTTAGVMDGNWHHLAYTRQGGVLRSFIDGVKQQEETWANTLDFVSGDYGFMIIGATPQQAFTPYPHPSTDSMTFTGWYNDIRLTKGVARYTANFTPPIQPFSNLT